MKIVITFILITFSSLCNAQFATEDQTKHFIVGTALSGITNVIVYSSSKNKKKAFWYSLGVSSLAGLIKEAYDSEKFSSKLDTGEVLATSLGGLTASTTIAIFSGKKRYSKKNIALVN